MIRASRVDEALCLLFPILWVVVRLGGRQGAGKYAALGIVINALLVIF